MKHYSTGVYNVFMAKDALNNEIENLNLETFLRIKYVTKIKGSSSQNRIS